MAISPKLLNEGESVVLSMRTHPKVLFVPIIALILLLAAGVTLQSFVDNGTALLVGWIGVTIGILWFVVRPFLVWVTSVHAVTDRRLISRWGIITRRGHDIPLSRISDVSIEINLIDRPFGCGSLLITNASTHGEVRLHDIPHVEQTQLTLHNLIADRNEPQRRTDEGI